MPGNKHCILVCGGYGLSEPGGTDFAYFNDLVMIDTLKWVAAGGRLICRCRRGDKDR